MFLLSKPSTSFINQFINAQRNLPFAFQIPVGLNLLEGYIVDHNRIRLGSGENAYIEARAAIQRWEMFNLGWLELFWPDTPIEKGQPVAVLAAHLGFWSLNACRIVEVIEQSSETRRYGFTYGTLPDHAESGEETFSVEWSQEDDSVWYDILAYSKPNHWLARVGYVVARGLQKRFARDSMAAMRRSITNA